MSNPLVSVVMPAYNAAATVAEAVASMSRQTYCNLEIIVVDDGSTDATGPIVQRLASDDPRIQLIRGGHRGLVAALNEGLAASSGVLIARMDADDVSYPDRITR